MWTNKSNFVKRLLTIFLRAIRLHPISGSETEIKHEYEQENEQTETAEENAKTLTTIY